MYDVDMLKKILRNKLDEDEYNDLVDLLTYDIRNIHNILPEVDKLNYDYESE